MDALKKLLKKKIVLFRILDLMERKSILILPER
jgi:hypothetical protein